MLRPLGTSAWHFVIAVAACSAIVLSVLSNVGLCPWEMKFLKDSDYFRGAIEVVIRDPVDGVVERSSGAIDLKPVHSRRYSDADEFLNEFPNCCRFAAENSNDGGPDISILDRLAGVRVVQVSYEKKYSESDGSQRTAGVTAKVAVTNCGKGRSYR